MIFVDRAPRDGGGDDLPEPEKGGKGKRSEKSESLAKAIGVGKGHAANMISEARAVVPYPDLSKGLAE